MALMGLAAIQAATEDNIYETLYLLNGELRDRIGRDGGLPTQGCAAYPTAVALLCEVESSSGYPTAEPSGVLLADGTTVPIGRGETDETARAVWAATCDEVANLAGLHEAMVEDRTHGWMISFAVADRTAIPDPTVRDAPRPG